jgi:hypothetical protein
MWPQPHLLEMHIEVENEAGKEGVPLLQAAQLQNTHHKEHE